MLIVNNKCDKKVFIIFVLTWFIIASRSGNSDSILLAVLQSSSSSTSLYTVSCWKKTSWHIWPSLRLAKPLRAEASWDSLIPNRSPWSHIDATTFNRRNSLFQCFYRLWKGSRRTLPFNGRTRQNLLDVFILFQRAMEAGLRPSRRNTSKTTSRSVPEAIKL